MNASDVNKHFELFGLKVRDKVTGFVGVVESVSFDLYGCVQGVVRPPANDKGELGDGRWFDMKRLEAIDHTPVMALPVFALVPGGTEKPAHDRVR